MYRAETGAAALVLTASLAAAQGLPLAQRAEGTAARGASSNTAARSDDARAADGEVQQDGAGRSGNQTLGDEVFVRLAGRATLGSDIEVEARDGVVTLTGSVPSESAKRRAVRIARRTAGVREVKDQLRVASADAGQRAQSAEPVADAQLAERTARAIADGIAGAKAGEDWWFSGWRVEAPDNDWSLVVEADAGAITLEGDVPRSGIVRSAVEAAREVPGVQRVYNELDVVSGYTGYAVPYGYYPYGYYTSPYRYSAYGPAPQMYCDAAAEAASESDGTGATAGSGHAGERQAGGERLAGSDVRTVRGEVTKIDQRNDRLTLQTKQGRLVLPLPLQGGNGITRGDQVTVDLALRRGGSAAGDAPQGEAR